MGNNSIRKQSKAEIWNFPYLQRIPYISVLTNTETFPFYFGRIPLSPSPLKKSPAFENVPIQMIRVIFDF